MQLERSIIGKFVLMGAILTTFAVGCGDSSDSGGDSADIPDSGMEATIDGESWEAQGANAFDGTQSTDGEDAVTLSALGALNSDTSQEDNELLEAEVFSEPGASSVSTGTYDVAGEGTFPRAEISYIIRVDGNDTGYRATTGNVEVVEVTDDGFAGVFSGTLVNVNDESDTIELTDGGFNVEFPF